MQFFAWVKIKKPNFKDFWIGLTDAAAEGDFIWRSDKKPLSRDLEIHWEKGQPDNSGRAEHCGHFYNYGLNDAPCDYKTYSVCQKQKGNS